jgi:hypothetical protein
MRLQYILFCFANAITVQVQYRAVVNSKSLSKGAAGIILILIPVPAWYSTTAAGIVLVLILVPECNIRTAV